MTRDELNVIVDRTLAAGYDEAVAIARVMLETAVERKQRSRPLELVRDSTPAGYASCAQRASDAQRLRRLEVIVDAVGRELKSLSHALVLTAAKGTVGLDEICARLNSAAQVLHDRPTDAECIAQEVADEESAAAHAD